MKNTSYMVFVTRTTMYRVSVPGEGNRREAMAVLAATPVDEREAVRDEVHNVTAQREDYVPPAYDDECDEAEPDAVTGAGVEG